MIPSRLPGSARKLSSRVSKSVLRPTAPCMFGSSPAPLRTRAAFFNSASRVKLQRPLPTGRTTNLYQHEKILQSAFPTKTFLFLVVLGAAAYYFVDIRYADWADAVLESHGDDPLATPLHFYKDREELDHWIHAHVPDPAGPARDPTLLQAINAQFEKLVLGWRMNEDEAREANLPITHGCQMKSNQACEDTYALGTSPGPGGLPWNYWGVYDGHAGRFTSMHLQWHLIPQLSRALSNVSPQSSSNVIADTIMAAFVRVDDDMMARAKHAASWYPAANNVALHTLAPAFSGSCALLAAFDPEKDKLRVACTGDSRAVLGRWDALEQKYICKPLSVDQTGFNQDEVERIKAAHPDEPDILNPDSGRLLGLAVTRAFGDHRWKWENGFIRTLQAKFWGTPPRPNSRTPPYLTAEPVVTETDVVRVEPHPSSPVKSDFMILASDGLWDRISSEHAVECVSRWIDARDRNAIRPVDLSGEAHPRFEADRGLAFDEETGEAVSWKATPEYFAIEDDNAACCLLRNVLGGTRRGLFFGALTVPPPWSRDAMDDTTVMVVFFDKIVGQPQGQQQPQQQQAKSEKKWWKPW